MSQVNNPTPSGSPKKKRFKGGSLTWKEDGSPEQSKAWLRILSDKTILFRLPSYGPFHHLHFGLKQNATEVKFFLQFSDERQPERTSARRKTILRVGPLPKDDFRCWGAWLQKNQDELGKLAVEMMLAGFTFRTFSQLRDLGWKTLPHKDELLKSDKLRKGKIDVTEQDLKKLLEDPLLEPTQMLVDIKGHESKTSQLMAYKVSGTKEELAGRRKETEAQLSDASTPAWLKAKIPEILNWVDSNSILEGDGPLYLVGNASILLSHFGDLSEFVLQGALESFKDKKVVEWVGNLKPKLGAAFREGDTLEKVLGLIGLDLPSLLKPAFIDLDSGLSKESSSGI